MALVFQRGKALAYGLFGERGYPKSLNGTFRPGLLHNPALDEFTLLPGIAAVDYTVGGLHKTLDNCELALYALLVLQADAETGGDHGQLGQAPCLPHGRILGRLLQFAQVTEGPSDLITVALKVAAAIAGGSEDIGYVTCYRWFFGYTDDHGRRKV